MRAEAWWWRSETLTLSLSRRAGEGTLYNIPLIDPLYRTAGEGGAHRGAMGG
jgi:hypothetical protein